MKSHLAEQLDEASDIYNVLCLVYNERSHDTFRAAVERLMADKYRCVVLDNSDHRDLEYDAIQAVYWENKYNDEVSRSEQAEEELKELRNKIEKL